MTLERRAIVILSSVATVAGVIAGGGAGSLAGGGAAGTELDGVERRVDTLETSQAVTANNVGHLADAVEKLVSAGVVRDLKLDEILDAVNANAVAIAAGGP